MTPQFKGTHTAYAMVCTGCGGYGDGEGKKREMVRARREMVRARREMVRARREMVRARRERW